MAQLILTTPGEDVEVGGSVTVIGTVSGGEVISITRGSILFDASFNAGGDTIVLPGSSGSYTVALTGSRAILASDDVSVSIPLGLVGTSIEFGNATLNLLINPETGAATLGNQTITPLAQPVGATGPQTEFGTNVFLETEPNETINSADAISRDLLTSAPNDPNVTNPDTPSLVIRGQIENNNDIDAFSIHLIAGETLILDVDGAYDPDDVSSLDSIIGIWDGATGAVVSDNDNGGTVDNGSDLNFDSFLTYVAPVSGTYYFGIISAQNGTAGGSAEDYHLVVSIEGTMADQQGALANPKDFPALDREELASLQAISFA